MSRRLLTNIAQRACAAALGLAGATACSGPLGEPLDEPAALRQSVIAGADSGAADDGVIVVWGDAGTVIQRCTGTMIAPNLVLTARHCISDFVDLPFSCTPNGELTPDSMGGQVGATVPPAKVSIHLDAGANKAALGAQIFTTDSATICLNDIALVVLDRELPQLPLSALRLGAGTSPGETLRVVGWGYDENNVYGTRRALDGVIVSMVGQSAFRPQGDPVPPQTFMTQGPAMCLGDSGGPAFDAQRAVLGVFSQVTGACTSNTARDYFTEVAPFVDELVMPAFRAAGHDPIIEPLPDAGTPDAAAPDAGGADAGAEPSYYEPRQPGGCRCRLGAGSGTGAEGGWAALFALGVYARRLTRARRPQRK